MEKLKRAVIREEYFALTKDTMEAIILNQFIYWSERVRDFDKFILEEKERVEKFAGPDVPPVQIELTNGWIYKKTSELKVELMLDDSVSTVRRKIRSLVDKGYILERNNPLIKYDRTLQYRVDLIKINQELNKIGYVIPGYKVEVPQIQNENSKMQGDDSKNQIDDLKKQIENLKRQNDALKNQNDSAIPKTTPETTPEIGTEESYSETDIINTLKDKIDISNNEITYIEYWLEKMEPKTIMGILNNNEFNEFKDIEDLLIKEYVKHKK